MVCRWACISRGATAKRAHCCNSPPSSRRRNPGSIACRQFEVGEAGCRGPVRCPAGQVRRTGERQRSVMQTIDQKIASELGVGVGQVVAAMALLSEGATVPFIARYRKEKTGG